METSTILTADVLDILFEGRNKEYGAYDLRRTYKKRLTLSITVMLSVIFMLFIGFVFAGKKTQLAKEFIIPPDATLADIKPDRAVEPPPPPPPPKPPDPPKVEMAKFTPPKIVKDEEVKEDEKPPETAKLEDTKIGIMNQEGLKDEGIVAPPIEDGGNGVIVAPKKEEEENWKKTFTKVEIESEYPGGPPAWQRYLTKNLRFSQEAIDNQIQGTVVVKFIVDQNGMVSDVQAISGPVELYAEAVRVIKKSGKWTPAIQNGHQVKSYKNQGIAFRLVEE
ncbi:energy transducer TonB [Niastella caeni]|uniref:Energy transducer TonB n=1 Tax=Niastella caeni TaxID=2569763 RepID=A0A4S8HZQ6_9BACT|nr:energy transducer TonB [Niastella caeni]THU41237.1 energy transducer TonB [Niastella caeni]